MHSAGADIAGPAWVSAEECVIEHLPYRVLIGNEGIVAAALHHPVRRLVKSVLWHPECSERGGQAQPFQQGKERTGGVVGAEDSCSVRHRIPGAWGNHGGRLGEQRRMRFGVREFPSTAEDVTGAVMHRNAGLRKRDAGETRADKVVAVAVNVCGVVDHERQTRDQTPAAVNGERCGDWVRSRGPKGFEAVRERIHPGRPCKTRGMPVQTTGS